MTQTLPTPALPDCPRSLQTLLLNRINLFASLPVLSALSKLALSSSPPASDYIQLSDTPATLFTSPGDIDASFDIWLQIPVPNSLHRSNIHQALAKASEDLPGYELSLESTAHSDLVWAARTSPEMDLLVGQLLKELKFLPLDTPIRSLNPFRSSHLPQLISDTWLSDDHINACCDFINTHPNRPNHIRAVHSFFLGSLRLRFERSDTNRRRSTPLDNSIAEGTVCELLVPVHRPSHWALLYIDLATWEYAYIDSLRPDINSVPSSVISPVNAWASEIFNRDVALRPGIRPFALGQQLDSHSCGVAVMSSMAHYALGGSFEPWLQNRAKAHRLRWTLTFASANGSPIPDTAHASHDLDPNDFDDEYFTSEIVFEDAYTPSTHRQSSLSSTIDSSDSLDSLDHSLSDTHTSITPSPSPQNAPTAKRQLIQSKLPFKSVSVTEWRIQESRRFHERQEEREKEVDRLALAKEQKKKAQRERERARKRAQRARQKALRSALLDRAQTSADNHITSNNPLSSRRTIALKSRPHSAAYKADHEDPQATTSHRINWTNSLIWPQIERAAIAVGYPWSPVEIVRRLQLLDPETFASLRPQRISQWRDHRFANELRWTESHQRSIEAGDRPTRAGTGRVGILQNHPRLVQAIKSWLTDLRKAGVPLDIETIRGYMAGVIRHSIPDAFTRANSAGRVFRCSREFVRAFLRRQLGWSLRKATRAAQKYPSDVNTVLLHAFLLFARVVRDEEVPAACIVNADQTQVVYNAGGHSTWNPSGERQVHILGNEEKRAFTLLVAASLSGEILPFQAIYGGKTSRSLPDSNTRGHAEARKLGFLLDFSGSETYWSTMTTMQRFVSQILAPYFRTQIQLQNLPPTQ
ncbi:hypothetical protein FRC09_008822 [Ceratobasidium sp. 395]|nr:hypothetical protein FRC09_008822 [Ceratobasidium sp. 395]